MAISQHLSQNLEKNKGTLFYQTLKVEENKVPLFFSILAGGLRYSHNMELELIFASILFLLFLRVGVEIEVNANSAPN